MNKRKSTQQCRIYTHTHTRRMHTSGNGLLASVWQSRVPWELKGWDEPTLHTYTTYIFIILLNAYCFSAELFLLQLLLLLLRYESNNVDIEYMRRSNIVHSSNRFDMKVCRFVTDFFANIHRISFHIKGILECGQKGVESWNIHHYHIFVWLYINVFYWCN